MLPCHQSSRENWAAVVFKGRSNVYALWAADKASSN